MHKDLRITIVIFEFILDYLDLKDYNLFSNSSTMLKSFLSRK